MKLPIIWRTFRFANFFLLICFLLCFLLVSYALIKGIPDNKTMPLAIIIDIGILIIILNSIFNLFIISHFFPNKVILSKTKVLFNISTFFYSLSLLALLVFIVFGINEELKVAHEDKTGIIFAFILLLFFIIGLFILIMQLLAGRFIETNYKNSAISMIEAIGHEKE